MMHLVLDKVRKLWFMIAIKKLSSHVGQRRCNHAVDVFFPSEIGSKISSFFGGSNEDENKEGKVEVSGC